MAKTRAQSLSIGELARALGVSSDTLRHYERKGVIARPQRSANGYRQYPPETLARLQLIRRALAIGFTLDELAQVLSLRDRGGIPCGQVRRLAADKLARTEEQLRDLLALRDDLRGILKEWDARLARTASGKKASLLDALPSKPTRGRRPRPQFSTTEKPRKNQK